jgi:predicted Fe-Mo cluster-binding NifX family protein
MKIAIPSDDQLHISAHFGRTRGFMIFDIVGESIHKKYVSNTFTGHVQAGQHLHEDGHQTDTHSRIFSALDGVEVVIAGGMGRRLYADFEQKNIQVFVTRETNIENALKLFIQNELDNNEGKCCDH